MKRTLLFAALASGATVNDTIPAGRNGTMSVRWILVVIVTTLVASVMSIHILKHEPGIGIGSAPAGTEHPIPDEYGGRINSGVKVSMMLEDGSHDLWKFVLH